MDVDTGIIRIRRERANADRNLKPKKQHCGYLLQSWMPRKLRVDHHTEDYVAVRLQTPWAISDHRDPAAVMDLVTSDGVISYFCPGKTDEVRVLYAGGIYWDIEFNLQGSNLIVPKEVLRSGGNDDASDCQ